MALQAIAELGEKLPSPDLLALKAQAQPTVQLATYRRKWPEILKADFQMLSSYRILMDFGAIIDVTA